MFLLSCLRSSNPPSNSNILHFFLLFGSFCISTLAHLTNQTLHVSLGHLEGCLKDLVGIEEVPNGEELDHVVFVE